MRCRSTNRLERCLDPPFPCLSAAAFLKVFLKQTGVHYFIVVPFLWFSLCGHKAVQTPLEHSDGLTPKYRIKANWRLPDISDLIWCNRPPGNAGKIKCAQNGDFHKMFAFSNAGVAHESCFLFCFVFYLDVRISRRTSFSRVFWIQIPQVYSNLLAERASKKPRRGLEYMAYYSNMKPKYLRTFCSLQVKISETNSLHLQEIEPIVIIIIIMALKPKNWSWTPHQEEL